MSTIVQVMRQLRSMPPLPDVASRVLAIVREPDYSLDELVAVVRTDPALTGRILKLCNSSLFGLQKEIQSVSDAVAYIGARNLVKLVLVTCTGSYFRGLPDNGYADPGQLWTHTLACATACQSLAERCGYGQPAAAFTAGILHDIGRIALVQALEPHVLQQAATELMDPSADLLDVERRLFGIDHAAASAETLLECDDELTALLHTAGEVAMSLGYSEVQPARSHEPAASAMRRLCLFSADLDEVRESTAQEVARVGKLLNPEPALSR
jgi:HD-like signal output (HDOD) protein